MSHERHQKVENEQVQEDLGDQTVGLLTHPREIALDHRIDRFPLDVVLSEWVHVIQFLFLVILGFSGKDMHHVAVAHTALSHLRKGLVQFLDIGMQFLIMLDSHVYHLLFFMDHVRVELRQVVFPEERAVDFWKGVFVIRVSES